MFAYDITLYGILENSIESRDKIQSDLNNILDWFQKFQLSLSLHKCVALLLTHSKISPEFKIPFSFEYFNIPFVSTFRDLGIQFSDNLKFSSHIESIVSKAHLTSNCILRSFPTNNSSLLVSLFKTFVRSKIEYASQIWNPHRKKEINLIERVQRKFTKRLSICKNLNYNERLQKLDLDTLEIRRIKLDLYLVYKIIHHLVDIPEKFFKFSKLATRGHSLKIVHDSSSTNIRRYFFTVKLPFIWNSLPTNVVSSSNFLSFKNNLDTIDLNLYCNS